MDNSESHQQKRGSLIPLSPFQTPKLMSEKSSRDSRSSDGNSSNKHDKDRGVNVQVILRCRPLSEDEVRVKMPVVVACNEVKCEVIVVQNTAHKQIDRTFVFDKVFGPTSQQKDLYNEAVGPIVNEALEGYNCTIFAYGQTGSGKTYTMEGEGSKYKNGEFHKDAGLIPRAVEQIFGTLEAQNAEYSMKVTFLELYNEEIADLLGPDDKSKKPIALMEDGKGAVFVRGLEEEVVCTAEEIFEILAKGSAKKHTGETLLNKQTNRSHSIFSITIHIKECTPEGIELIKCGKLNLVDLAGSENILRSGAREGRAREAGEINKSLLTLGRVINALVEQSRHVPYRASKLTRLLRDSLGGKTKTCMIATISPSMHCLEETLSTLDYAYRAKNIKNRPEVNQKVIKSALLKDLYMEIDHLKRELYATREKNGIYIPRESYLNDEAVKKAMAEKIERVELDSRFKDKQMMELQGLFIYQQQLTAELKEELARTRRELEHNENALFDIEDRCRQANETIKEQEYLIFNLLGSEKALTERAFKLRDELETAASEVSGLFANIEQKNKIEDRNEILIQNFHTQLAQQLQILHKTVAHSMAQHEHQLKVIEANIQSFTSAKARATRELQVKFKKLKDMYSSGIKSLDGLAGGLGANFELAFGNINSLVSSRSSSLVDLFGELSSEIDAVLDDLKGNLNNQKEEIAAFAEQQHESHSRTLQTTQSISRVAVNFFKTLSMYASKLTLMAEEAQTMSDQKLCSLEKQFEEHAANEERQLLERVAELLASSNARTKELVQAKMDCLRESASSRTSKLHQEMSNMQDLTSSVQEEWTSYMGKTEAQYIEDSIALEIQKVGFVEDIRHCMTKARMVAEKWQNAEESILGLQRRNVNSVDSTIQSAMEDNQMLRDQFSSLALSMLEEADCTQRSFLSSIQYSLKLDSNNHAEIISLLAPCYKDTREMKTAHSHKILEITENAGKCLIDEFMVDKPSCSTPRKRLFDLPSTKSIEDLRTPSFEELLKSFQAAGSVKQENGDVDKSPRPYEIAASGSESSSRKQATACHSS